MTEAALATRTEPVLPAKKPSTVTELWRFRQLIGLLVVRELKVRYKRSIFGLLWTMLNPLLLMIVYSVVFTTLMASSVKNFSIFLLAGLLPWNFFAIAVMQGLFSVLGNQDLIRKIRLPQAIFPLSVVGSNLVNYTLSLVPLFVLMLALRQPFSWALLFLPVATVILTVFTSGVTLLLASFTVFFRDVRHLTEVALQMLLYLSPVLYDLSMLGEHHEWWFRIFRTFLRLNPISYLIPLVRDPVFYARMPTPGTLGIASFGAFFTFFLGLAIFARLAPRHIHYF